MTTLRVPDRQMTLTDEPAIRSFLQERGIFYQRWNAGAGDTEILATHAHWLKPFMENRGYRSADIVTVTPETPHLQAIREKFLREHTHAEDEVRFFVTGHGTFWFHTGSPADEVFALCCEQGDLLVVPANTKHWFDLGDQPNVCAIRVFTDQAGWIPHYTDSGIEQQYR